VSEVRNKRVDPDTFDGFAFQMQGIELAAALRIAEILPVGRFVTGTSEARFLDKGLEQDRSIGVTDIPVMSQAPRGEGEDARSEVFAVDPWKDEEPGVIDDEMQITFPLLPRPTDEGIAWVGFPGTGAKAERCNDLAAGADKVTQLRARQRLMPQVVMSLDVRIPQSRFITGSMRIPPRSI
jgi:hypothetical protein